MEELEQRVSARLAQEVKLEVNCIVHLEQRVGARIWRLNVWSLKSTVLYICAQRTHAYLANIHFWKAWLCDILKIIKGWHCAFGGSYSGAHEKGAELTHLEFFFFHFLCFILYFWASHDYERLNYPFLGVWIPNTLDVMIFTIHLMLFQYYYFLSKFIALFMVWSSIHMYVIGF